MFFSEELTPCLANLVNRLGILSVMGLWRKGEHSGLFDALLLKVGKKKPHTSIILLHTLTPAGKTEKRSAIVRRRLDRRNNSTPTDVQSH